MMTLEITKEMISNEICGVLCGMAESVQDQSFEWDDRFEFISDWDNGRPLTVTWKVIMIGYKCYGTDRIPKFISEDWDRALKIYKKLKGL